MSIYGAILIQMLLSFKIFSHHTPNAEEKVGLVHKILYLPYLGISFFVKF